MTAEVLLNLADLAAQRHVSSYHIALSYCFLGEDEICNLGAHAARVRGV